MKKLPILALCALVLLSCAACGGGTEQDGAQQSGGEAASPASGGGTVVVAIGAGFSTLDPGRAYEKYPPLIINACYENLFKFRANDAEPEPCLAESYAFSPDGMTLTVTLRDAVFAGGGPVTSGDVRFSIERCRNLRDNPSFICDTIERIETPDDRTVVFHLTQPDSAILSKLTHSSLAILDSAAVRENGGTDAADAATADDASDYLNTTSAGSGMYVMTSYTPGEEIVLEKNPDYRGDATNVDRYIIRIQPDPDAQMIALADGEADVAMNMTDDTMAELAGAEGIELVNTATKTVSFVMMNMDPAVGGPVSDPHVQRAIRLALDYDGVRSIVGEGCITPYDVIQCGFMGSRGERPAGYTDLEAARAELAQSPYPDGFSVDLTVCDLDMEGVALADLAQKVKSDLAPLGIDVHLVSQPWAAGYGDAYRDGSLAMTVMYWAVDYNDPNVQLEFLPGETVGLRAGWSADADAALHAKYDEAMNAADAAERVRVLGEIQDMMYEDGPFVFIAQAPAHIGCSMRLAGVAEAFSDPYVLDLTRIRVR